MELSLVVGKKGLELTTNLSFFYVCNQNCGHLLLMLRLLLTCFVIYDAIFSYFHTCRIKCPLETTRNGI